jgi:hypothetical protein
MHSSVAVSLLGHLHILPNYPIIYFHSPFWDSFYSHVLPFGYCSSKNQQVQLKIHAQWSTMMEMWTEPHIPPSQ